MARKPTMPLAATTDALTLLGTQIRQGRIERGWTIADLAERAHVSEGTIKAVENGAPGTAIATVLNTAVLAGVPLFGAEDHAELARLRRRGEERLALLPSRVRQSQTEGDPDDFAF